MRRIGPVAIAAFLLVVRMQAAEITRGDLAIRGLSLTVDGATVVTAIDIAASVQTIFGGRTNDEAPPTPDLVASAELSGPGIDAPITLSTQPGHKFQLPPLHQQGDYALQNIRLADASGRFIQQAVPSSVTIAVTDVFKTSVKVRQLSPDELRARGINLDARNFDVFVDMEVRTAISLTSTKKSRKET